LEVISLFLVLSSLSAEIGLANPRLWQMPRERGERKRKKMFRSPILMVLAAVGVIVASQLPAALSIWTLAVGAVAYVAAVRETKRVMAG